MNTNTTPNGMLFQWRAPARPAYERSHRWYAVMGVFVLTLVVYGLASGAWTMSIVILMAAGVFFLVRNERAHEYAVEITPMGITIDGEMHEWATWANFWILVYPEHTEFHVLPKRTQRRDFVIMLPPTIDPIALRSEVLSYLPEDPHQREKLFDKISRICKL